MLIVIAVGGNALLQPNEPLIAENLLKNVAIAAEKIAKIANEHQIVLVHGNGPQVGLLALQSESYRAVSAYPFNILIAESQGMIGYVLQQALRNALPNRDVVTVLTQVIVDVNDKAFLSPTKPIGSFYNKNEAQELKNKFPHWHFQETAQGFRRVVASPQPKTIVELNVVGELLQKNNIVIAGGGGGIPCIYQEEKIKGIEAVIDKDLTASLLARLLQADRLIILTNVAGAYENWGKDNARLIEKITVDQLSTLFFEKGSMQPKIEAACHFVKFTKKEAFIGHFGDLESIVKNKAGTRIVV